MWDEPKFLKKIYFDVSDDDKTRFTRLKMVAAFIFAKIDGTEADVVPLPISQMRDSRGTLIVVWSDSVAMKRYSAVAHEAWSKVGGEPDFNVENSLDEN